MSQLYQYEIKTGKLNLNIDEGDPNELFQVESRKNPKRGFLFVSKVLGKHLPVQIENIDLYHKKIATQLSERIDFSKKTLVIGMAETATLLGYGVYKNIEPYFTEKNVYFIHSTRISNDKAIAFEESHSHAPTQFIHLEEKDFEQVILIDDELSTGNTFMNFEKILKENLPNLSRIIWGCLTDFRKEDVKNNQKDPNDVISLLKGQWSFEWTNKPEPLHSIENLNKISHKDVHSLLRYSAMNTKNNQFLIKDEIKEIMKLKGKVLIIGTGEFMPLPYEVANLLQQNDPNNEIYFQATTRSPADMKGFSWEIDHYLEGVPQFLYNYNRNDYDHVILFVENKPNEISNKMAQDLDATLIGMKEYCH